MKGCVQVTASLYVEAVQAWAYFFFNTETFKNRNIGCPNKSAIFNFVINAPFIQKVLIFLFQYKVHILRLIVEHNIRQMSSTTLLSRGGRKRAHFKSCALVGTPHILKCWSKGQY